MGGGGAMRAAAKVAGFGVVNGGFRGVPAEHQVVAAARKATRPVSAIVSSSEEVQSSVLSSSQNNVIEVAVQRPCWELDDWEFAGDGDKPKPRLVFGGAPTLQEAKEATCELKDAIEKVYLSPNSTGSVDSYIGHESAFSLLSKPEYPETKACVTIETGGTSVPTNALRAFRLINESPAAQTVVASIASDPNVWDAVMQNPDLVEFLQSYKSTASFSDMDPLVKESVADTEFLDHQSPKNIDDYSDSEQSADSGNGFKDFLQSVRITVVEMVTSLSNYFQNLFGGPTAEKAPADDDGSARTTFDKAMGASFMGLVVMVVMLVVLKRG